MLFTSLFLLTLNPSDLDLKKDLAKIHIIVIINVLERGPYQYAWLLAPYLNERKFMNNH